MKNSPPRLRESTNASLSLPDLENFAERWFLDGEIRRHSERTVGTRREIVRRLLWFLRHRKYSACGETELTLFIAYLTNGHKESGGRWGNPQQTKLVKPRTVKDYHAHLCTLFSWIVAGGGLTASPMGRVPKPLDRPDDVQPFTETQVNDLLTAAKRSRQPRRDEAILLFLFDTGLRASELCSLRFKDVDMTAKKATVEGKGGKTRPVYFGRVAARALWAYLKEDGREAEEPIFLSERGDALTRSGLQQLLERLGAQAHVTSTRCSPHTFRHTFAVSFLRAGGNQFTLMNLLGHTNIQMTSRYVRLAQADVENQHRQFSPADRLKGKQGR